MSGSWTQSNYFTFLPQRLPLLTAERNHLREAWCIVHQISDFDNMILRKKIDFSFADVYENGRQIQTLSKNGVTFPTSGYIVGWNAQMGFNFTCLLEQKYICNKVLWHFRKALLIVEYCDKRFTISFTIGHCFQDRTLQPLTVTGLHRITWP